VFGRRLPASLEVSIESSTDPGGIAGDERLVGDVFDDDRARSDDRVIANLDAGIDDRTPADPDVLADGDWLASLDALASPSGRGRVGRGVEVHAGT